jgi:hypothetical protein
MGPYLKILAASYFASIHLTPTDGDSSRIRVGCVPASSESQADAVTDFLHSRFALRLLLRLS